jgi:sugar phosphate isomerase/epimerase
VTPAVSTAAFDGHPMEVALDEMAALEVDAVEPAFIKGYVDFDETVFSDASAARLSGLLVDRRLSVWGVSAHMDLSAPEAGAMLARRIAFAGALGAQFIITNAGPARQRDAILRRLDEALPRLDATGVTLALENPGHGTGDLIGRGEEGAALIQALGAPRIRLNLDVGNLLTYAAGLEPGLSAALPFAAHAHLKDIAVVGPDWHFVPLGEGLVDWTTVAQKLRERSPTFPLAIELPLRLRRPQRSDPIRAPDPLPLTSIREAIRRSLDAWDRAIT